MLTSLFVQNPIFYLDLKDRHSFILVGSLFHFMLP